ncbi:hypothetical protein NC980_23665 [Leptolyngbya sp. AS-A5]
MNRFLLVAFSLMVLSAISTISAIAQTRERENVSYNPVITQATSQLTPADLASFAYRSYFKSQGISGYGVLIQEHSFGKVTAKDIVQATVNTYQLPASTLNDRAYLNTLDSQLRELNLH